MTGSVTFIWTEKQYAAALRAQLRLGITKRTWVVMAVAALAGLAIATLPFFDDVASGSRIGLSMIGAMVALFLPLCHLFVALRAPRVAHRIFGQQPTLSEPVTVSWSEEGLRYEVRNGSVMHEWKAMYYWALLNHTFFFAANERLYHIVPVEVLGDMAADLKALATANVARRR